MTWLRDNRKLLDKFKAGSEDAVRAVYHHYVDDIEWFVSTGWFDPKTRVRTFGFKNLELQAELIQDVFLKAFSEKARLAYDGIRPYKTYLRTVAKNVIIDYVRKHRRDAISHVCLELDDTEIATDQLEIEGLRVEADVSEESMHWDRCVDFTAQYVNTLDEMERQFIMLRFQEELSLLEVARRLGVTRGRARWLEKQLGLRLKTHLSENDLLER